MYVRKVSFSECFAHVLYDDPKRSKYFYVNIRYIFKLCKYWNVFIVKLIARINNILEIYDNFCGMYKRKPMGVED